MARVRPTPPATPMPETTPATPAPADPNPLGLSAWALPLFVLSLVNLGVPGGGEKVVLSLAIFYGGLMLLIAALWEFRASNTFGATAYGSLAAFWLSYAIVLVPTFFGLGNRLPTDPSVGVFFLGWAIVTAVLLLASLRTSAVLVAAYALFFLTLVALGLAEILRAATWTSIGGWLGILTAIVAWYAMLAALLRNVSRGQITLPIYPLR